MPPVSMGNPTTDSYEAYQSDEEARTSPPRSADFDDLARVIEAIEQKIMS